MKKIYPIASLVLVILCAALTQLKPVANETLSIVFDFVGTLHPMLLHLPIGLWFGTLCILLAGTKIRSLSITPWVFAGSILTLATGVLSFSTGLILYLAGQYTDSMVRPHMYGAVAFLVAVAVFGSLVQRKVGLRWLWFAALLVSGALGYAGHKGGVITHGDPMEKAPWIILADEPD